MRTKRAPENKVPSILKAKTNVILSDLNNFQIKAGETVNLYSLFPPGIVRKSASVKYALDTKALVQVGTDKNL
jgi:hypothetical protein